MEFSGIYHYKKSKKDNLFFYIFSKICFFEWIFSKNQAYIRNENIEDQLKSLKFD
jgi:hypothetical protein